MKKRIKQVQEHPVIPIYWGMNKPGMQATVEADEETKAKAIEVWLEARDAAVIAAQKLEALGIHKQTGNRILEPFCHAQTVLSATEWANFFSLRWHPDAQPEFFKLAEVMKDAYLASKPTQLEWGQWHLPFIQKQELSNQSISVEDLVKASVARCARASYENHEGKEPSIQDDLGTFLKLVMGIPVHASPGEHPAYACNDSGAVTTCNHHGNYKGFHQFRKTLANENIETFPWSNN